MQHCKREYCNAGTRQWSQRGIYIRKASKAKNSEQIIIRSNDSRYRGYPKTEKNAIQQRGVVTIQEAVTGFLAEKENTIKLSSYLRYEQMLRKHQQLQTIDADTLLSTTLPPTRFIIDRLLPQGLHILAGAPKVGKSWLALWLCLQVAQGTSVWDFPTHRGTVLYLCLEDSLTRIQSRLFQITDDAPEALHFATIAAGIGEGLEEQLTNFLTQHPDTSLVVIDTLQRIRTGSDSGNPYANDYRDISVLKALADKHHIAILLIHHLRKMNDDDPMNMISGTTGISGATDSNFVLKERRRGSGEATLYCTGRDIEYRELPLVFDKSGYTWRLTEPVEGERTSIDPEAISLSVFLRGLGSFEGTATELSALLEAKTGERLTPSVLSKRLVKYAEVLEQNGIRVVSERTRTTRMLSILCLPCDGSDGSDGKN